MENIKKIIELDLSTLPDYQVRDFFQYKSDKFVDIVKKMSDDIVVEDNEDILSFKIEILPIIREELLNFKLKNEENNTDIFFKIENIISEFLFKNYKINRFVFGDELLQNFLNYNSIDIYAYFENEFLNIFYKFIKNILTFNIPTINNSRSIGPLDNGTLFCYFNNGKLNFKYEYFISDDIYKSSFEESEINLVMEEFEENTKEIVLLENKKQNKEKIEQFEDFGNAITRILDKCINNKKNVFKSYIYKETYNDLTNISIFLGKYNNIIYNNLNNSLYVNYFSNLIKYIIENMNFGTFEQYNVWFGNSIELSTIDENLYSKLGNNFTFYSMIIQEFDKIIEKHIDTLIGGKIVNTIIGEEINGDDKDIFINDIVKEKIKNYHKVIKDIVNELNTSSNDIIVNVLNKNNLFENLENLIYFIEENQKILDDINGEKVYKNLLWISENLFLKSFSEMKDSEKIDIDEFNKLPSYFLEVTKKLYS